MARMTVFRDLRDRKHLPADSRSPRWGLQLLVFPSFTPEVAIDVVYPDSYRNEPLRCYRTIWDAEPVVTAVEPDPKSVLAVCDAIGGLRLQLHPKLGAGIDGTTYELSMGNSWGETRIRFWYELPRSWRSLAKPLNELLRMFGVSDIVEPVKVRRR